MGGDRRFDVTIARWKSADICTRIVHVHVYVFISISTGLHRRARLGQQGRVFGFHYGETRKLMCVISEPEQIRVIA